MSLYNIIKHALKKPKIFEGIIGKKMWYSYATEIDAWYEERNFRLEPIDVTDSVSSFSTTWTRFCYQVHDKFYNTSLNLYQRATAIRNLLDQADKELGDAFWYYSKYTSEKYHLRRLIRDCDYKIDAFIEYCNTISVMDKNNTWDSCALAMHLTENKMKQETAIKICKELGALKKEDLLEIQQNDIYGDVTTNYTGLSLTISEKNELHQIWLAMHASREAAKVQAELADLKAKITPSDLGETDEMGEGTYTGKKKDGKRHGLGFMFYNNKDTYYGDWTDDKMNGRGTFCKNVRGPLKYDWTFYGQFIDNCPKSGTLQKPTENQGLYMDVAGVNNIFVWNPFPSDTAHTPGLKRAMSSLMTQLRGFADSA